ncbi:hypothetical protein AXF42_Ash015817 [Apostasia shenzhenica]|uniref:Glycosyl transferase family 1 domain-containing protein n=1 Tax=Apostasia shenzhenica TaxID=1088818 RepID=A0A2H9ZXN7_9ASPA|nr:hypothetical protein AXF42_Ash015817 [Apostasia shenzhenica]
MNEDSQTLVLFTLGRALRELGYVLSVFVLEEGEAHPKWEDMDCHVSLLCSNLSISVDWTIYEGVILSSLEAKSVISSLMQDPFNSVPLIWLIQEDRLGKRLSSYVNLGRQQLVFEWTSAFSRANVVVFSDFSLPMMYSLLDSGNFYVIPGSPADVWMAKRYMASHSRQFLRKAYGFQEDDLIIVIIGSDFLYDESPCGYAAGMLTSQIIKITRIKDLGGMLKFAFLCGNSTYSFVSDFEELASRVGFPIDSVRHYGLDGDVNGVLRMADIVLYGSFQEEQNVPPLLLRAMSFEIPVVVPDLAAIKKYVTHKVQCLIFHPHDIDTLASAFLLLIEDKKLSTLARSIAHQGRLLAENLLVTEFLTNFANLIENMLHFPSDSFLPEPVSEIQQNTWAWNLFDDDYNDQSSGFEQIMDLKDSPAMQRHSIIDILEEKLSGNSRIGSPVSDSVSLEYPTQLDWDEIRETEMSEDFERREMEELAERMERNLGSWEDVYRNAKKSEKLRFEMNERDEGELERTGQSLCIYEIYGGQGAWDFLHHGSLYRGITLSRSNQRPRSDDVDALSRLPILNDSYYRDIFCDFGAMLSIANRIDSIHKIPWIGFQSWHASGRKVNLDDIVKALAIGNLVRQPDEIYVRPFGLHKTCQVSLTAKAEKVLEEMIQGTRKGDDVYYWAVIDKTSDDKGIVLAQHFVETVSLSAFESAFKSMYGIPLGSPALPPMPNDGGKWSALHSWVMPTSSFLEYVMFSRIFVDSLHSLSQNSSNSSDSCILGSSELERRHCYCRLLEALVNVWAYHSARRMFYLDPNSGDLDEQHPVELRRMWVKYFSPTLLKSMDEDLAEEADDNMHPTEGWLWPLTGEVHWQGILDREREERYRKKMDKKRKIKEKLLDRHKHGYKQKSLGNP